MFDLTASPLEAQIGYQRFCESLGRFQPEASNRDFMRLFGNSTYLTNKVIGDPRFYEFWSNDRHRRSEKPLHVFQDEITHLLLDKFDSEETIEALKNYKYREYVRLTIRELCLDNQIEIYREFSHLAFSIINAVSEVALKELLKKYSLKEKDVGAFTLIGMGKLGGYELNYSSDIDVIGVYEDDRQRESVGNHEFFVRLFQKISGLLTHLDHNGFLYRVDWDLRPEGRSGTLANSLVAMETYYETFGAEWERQAYIKAEVAFQHHDFGTRFLNMMRPFVYRKYLDENAVQNISRMRERMIAESSEIPGEMIDIKTGRGGIRDVEFLVQGLQLLNGGKLPQLRTPNTVEGLKVLQEFGFIKPEERDILKKGYFFLRRLESALQMENEQQIHRLQLCDEDLVKVGRRAGYTDDLKILAKHVRENVLETTSQVHSIFTSYFGERR